MKEEIEKVAKKGAGAVVKATYKVFGIKILIVASIIAVALILLGASLYSVEKWTVEAREGDPTSAPYMADEYSESAKINEDGTVEIEKSAEEVWDEMTDAGSNIEQYLDSPEEFAKLLNAEMVTQLVDTRPNPDEEINWEEIFKIDSKNTQGIVKFKRADSSGNKTTMSYVTPEEFDALIEEYNSTGSEDARKSVLSHFTIQENQVVKEESDDKQEDIDENEESVDEQEEKVNEEEEREEQEVSDDNNISEDKLYWPVYETELTGFYDEPRERQGVLGIHAAIDIGIPEGTEIYSADDGIVTAVGRDDSYGNYVIIDHGNNFQTLYAHNSENLVKVGDKVEKGNKIALSGNTGNTSGPHLHFETRVNGERVDPMQFEYHNGSGGTGSVNGAAETTTQRIVKVATYSSESEKIETNDPEVEEIDTISYNMTVKEIDYLEMIKGYTMPFDYLWIMLVLTNDKEFVMELADLVYNSEIEITVHDSLTTTTVVDVDTRTDKEKSDIEIDVASIYSDAYGSTEGSSVNPLITSKDLTTEERVEDFKTTTTKVNVNNVIDVKLTKANCWVTEYTQEFTYKDPETSENVNINELPDIGYDENETTIIENEDRWGYVNELKAEIIQDLENKKISVENEILEEMKKSFEDAMKDSSIAPYLTENKNRTVSVEVYKDIEEVFYSTINHQIETTTTVETSKYISTPAETREKVDKEPENGEKNFVTIFNDQENRRAKINILDATEWLFLFLEENVDTGVEMADLTRYLLYKATGTDYGVTKFEMNIFNKANNVMSINNLLDEYLKAWEAGSGPPKNADGTMYVIFDDGYGNLAVGYGVGLHEDAGNIPIFKENGYEIRVGEEVDIEFADGIKDQIMKQQKETLLSAVDGLDLTGYQINALLSYTYNGAPSISIFIDLYNEYWKESDDKFEEQDKNADFNHKLYTEYFSLYTSSNGIESTGLQNRRKSEWTLFQTGYYDILDKWHADAGALSTVPEYGMQFIGQGPECLPSGSTSDGSLTYNPGVAWCAQFVTMCFDSQGLIPSVLAKGIMHAGNSTEWWPLPGDDRDVIRTQNFETRNDPSAPITTEQYIPQAGDIIFFLWDDARGGSYSGSHVGIVTSSDGNKVYTIEGNTGGGIVRAKEYSINDSSIVAYYPASLYAE